MAGEVKLKPEKLLDKITLFCLENRFVVILGVIGAILWGIYVSPFYDGKGVLPSDPVSVDAIPDIGENQQIVFTRWPGRSPQDMEDQVSYPLTVSLLGIPGVKTVRSFSMFGFSTVYLIFEENVDFYWSRARIVEKLNSLPSDTLPEGVKPSLGPDATALGQVFWYTLEGRDEDGNPAGRWDLAELRSVQDWYVRYGLLAAEGISEVASAGGFVKEYQIEIDPDKMRFYGVTLEKVLKSVKESNLDIGAGTVEINKVEYLIRSRGFVRKIKDIENSVVAVKDGSPVYIKNIARVIEGPAPRRGALDKNGIEAVGGVAVVRYGENPLKAIENLKKKIAEISPGLPSKTLKDGRVSKITIVPFYDRTGLIKETLNTLNRALTEEILITIAVVLIMLMNFRSSLLISGLLPLAVLISFIGMKYVGIDANIVALSGIAIAIGTMVDVGIVMVENIVRHIKSGKHKDTFRAVYHAASEVGGAVLTAVSTTIVGFLPVFAMEGAEGKLFRPLAYTKTFALMAAVIVAVLVIPPFAHSLLKKREKRSGLLDRFLPGLNPVKLRLYINIIAVGTVVIVLAEHWAPLGPHRSLANIFFVVFITSLILGFFQMFRYFYPHILRWFLHHKRVFASLMAIVLFWGGMVWMGAPSIIGWMPDSIVKSVEKQFPGLGKEFMPSLDEGSYLYMPTTMPHASIGEVLDVLKKQDLAFGNIPEVEGAVGKLGRAETPLDPAPVSMIETVINYKSRFLKDDKGNLLRFRYDEDEVDFFRDRDGKPLPAADGKPYYVQGKFLRDKKGQLIPDSGGMVFLQWRPPLDTQLNEGREEWRGISSPEDIWNEIVHAGQITGTTSAPVLQPISARIVMLQSGMRAPIGIKIKGPDLYTIEKVGLQMEKLVKSVESVDSLTVFADRIIGKPYIEIVPDRVAIAQHGVNMGSVQRTIVAVLGGRKLTATVEGRERYSVRVRYPRELRQEPEDIKRVLVSTGSGVAVPLENLAEIKYVRGPQVIKSEDTFQLGYLLFDKAKGESEVDVVEEVKAFLEKKIEAGELEIPPGVSYSFAGNYQNQVRAEKKLRIILPLALGVILFILYLQFRKLKVAVLVFSGVIIAWAGGFIMLGLYGESWFMNFSFMGENFRTLFGIVPVNLSVAVWVGFLALFGIATDDGVLMATSLEQSFGKSSVKSRKEIVAKTIEAGSRRVRPALMTTATTILALLPVLTSTGRGADLMIPMAVPVVGGMLMALLSLFAVPVFYCWMKEKNLEKRR